MSASISPRSHVPSQPPHYEIPSRWSCSAQTAQRSAEPTQSKNKNSNQSITQSVNSSKCKARHLYHYLNTHHGCVDVQVLRQDEQKLLLLIDVHASIRCAQTLNHHLRHEIYEPHTDKHKSREAPSLFLCIMSGDAPPVLALVLTTPWISLDSFRCATGLLRSMLRRNEDC